MECDAEYLWLDFLSRQKPTENPPAMYVYKFIRQTTFSLFKLNYFTKKQAKCFVKYKHTLGGNWYTNVMKQEFTLKQYMWITEVHDLGIECSPSSCTNR